MPPKQTVPLTPPQTQTSGAAERLAEFNRRQRELNKRWQAPPSPTPPPPPPPPPPQPLGFSPITTIDIPPSPPHLGLSQITCVDTAPEEPTPEALSFNYYVLLSEEPVSEEVAPKKTRTSTPPKKTTPRRKRTRKTRKNPASVEAQAASPAPEIPSPNPTPTPTPAPATPAPTAAPPRPSNQTPRTTRTSPRFTQGIVIHGVALRKDLEKVRKWLEEDNMELDKKTTGIRWLRRKQTLEEEGKKTSSVVVYTKTRVETGKVRLGGKWLRSEKYEPNRKRE